MTGVLRLAQPGDDSLVADLLDQGIVVQSITRNERRLIVVARTARQTPIVAVVDRGPSEHDVAFARLMTKGLGHGA